MNYSTLSWYPRVSAASGDHIRAVLVLEEYTGKEEYINFTGDQVRGVMNSDDSLTASGQNA
jgi:hypothetical protein